MGKLWANRPSRALAACALAVVVGAPAVLSSSAQAGGSTDSRPRLSTVETSPTQSAAPRGQDSAFLVTTESGFNKLVVGLFALPGTDAGSAPEGLRGRAFNSAIGCAAASAAVQWRLPGSWLKVAKLMKTAWAGKAIAGGFSFRKVIGRQLLQTSITGTGLDLAGIHVCSEFAMWVNLLINSARSLKYNGQTHIVLHVDGSEFTSLGLWSCKVEPRWGPDIDDLNRATTATYLDNWEGPDASLWDDACPTPDDWDIPVKEFAVLWQEKSF